ncbi:hypothetical protein FFONT_0569 [Fervidicoccus fontis Kam940]|uniref:Uncharacterized protein n=1 Tax=Fervidicoccus fontis (strain DSM 19380 / JCM 18336 / VKM B-2539 / Kam940) TaxID=1163730 RepID=I0A0Q2_FERFK|nr:hypothetical protein FFONT_0569 [Fervidicoccus fontis Kam940]
MGPVIGRTQNAVEEISNILKLSEKHILYSGVQVLYKFIDQYYPLISIPLHPDPDWFYMWLRGFREQGI